MKGTHLGEFEELVLLVVGILHGDAYGVNVMDEIENQVSRKVSVSSVHTTLSRLEKKGFIESYAGPALPVRGGRSKRLYRMTMEGQQALNYVREQREQLWSLLPKLPFGFQGG